MKYLIALLIACFGLLVGCRQSEEISTANVVPEKRLATFLQQAKAGDFHDVTRTGKVLLKPGLLIPDHKTILKEFPSGIPEEGQVRYELMSFSGDGSAGGINLFLRADTGEIIQFTPFEAIE